MANPKKACFISYAHEGMDWDTFEYIVSVLKDALGNRTHMYIDKTVRYGIDFRNFSELVRSVDTIIILLTPEYRRKVYERKGGVYDEYTYIWQRYSDSHKPKAKTDAEKAKFEIIPILFSGNHTESIPDELRSIKYLDLTHLRVRRRKSGEFLISREDKKQFLPKLQGVASQILSSIALGSEDYQKLSDTYYDDLFIDLKASWDRQVEGRDLLHTQFVKTHNYYKIESQQAYFAIGRKGSGKSTLAQVLPLLQQGRYKAVIKIEANDFNLEALYSLYSDPQFRSDTSTVVPRQKAFEFTWEAVIILALIDKLIELAKTDVFLQSYKDLLAPMNGLLSKVRGNTSQKFDKMLLPSDYFGFCFIAMARFVRECIDGARNDPELFYTDIGVRFRLEQFLTFALGEEVYNSFWPLVRAIDRKVLITLDGFDTAFDEFRVTSIRSHDQGLLRSRAFFEIDWLRSLMGLAIRMKSSVDNYLYSILDFCLVAPMDRFMEVVHIERDSYRNWSRWFTIQWTGIEIAILLRKRLEGLVDAQTDENLNPQQRLEQILAHKQFSHIPVKIQFEFNGKQYDMPLFMYVLRHTFWRPREILLYYAKLLALAENLKRWGTPVTTDAIRKCIKATTSIVVESEFIDELKSTVTNIEKIIAVFYKHKSQFDYQTLRKALQKEIYSFATGDLSDGDVVAKVKFLYNIGFLGLKLTTEQQTNLGLWHDYAFYFNEGPAIFEDRYLSEDDLVNYTYVIHPIFSEYLRLDTKGFDLPLFFDWEYVRKSEAAMLARQ